MFTQNVSHFTPPYQAQGHEQRRYSSLINAIPSALIAVGKNDLITDWNRAAEQLFRIPGEHALGATIATVNIPWDAAAVLPRIEACLRQGDLSRLEGVCFTRADGGSGLLDITITALDDKGYVLLGSDITERQWLESQSVQAQKLKSIGQLTSGIAHEINTPTQYIGDNICFLKESHNGLERMLEACQRLRAAARSGSLNRDLLEEIDALYEAIDMDYLRREIPNAIQQSLEGIERVTKIVQAMKQFAYPDSGEQIPVDLNKAIESTIHISRNEWKYVAEIRTEFDSRLPRVPCLAGEFNQTLLNIILNAVHAIEKARHGESDPKGIITIGTQVAGDWVEIRIRDTGAGIPEHARSQIFDPFFTTKEVGKGTGQGLAIAYRLIVEKHKGTITFETEEGKGTTFLIRLPLQTGKG